MSPIIPPSYPHHILQEEPILRRRKVIHKRTHTHTYIHTHPPRSLILTCSRIHSSTCFHTLTFTNLLTRTHPRTHFTLPFPPLFLPPSLAHVLPGLRREKALRWTLRTAFPMRQWSQYLGCGRNGMSPTVSLRHGARGVEMGTMRLVLEEAKRVHFFVAP